MPNTDRRAEIVRQARQWVGTPYRHQHRVRQQGVDCVGLIIGAGHNAGVLAIPEEAWAPFAAYARTPNPTKMAEAMEIFLRRRETGPDLPPDGSVCWMGWRAHMPMHLGILATAPDGTGRRTLIHAYEHVGACVEHGFEAEWPGRVLSWWDYPGVLEA